MAKRRAHLHIEGVPNPSAMKFVLDNGILANRPYEFRSYKDAKLSPLARKILLFGYVDRVLINRNYVTVVKKLDKGPDWKEILLEMKILIQDHLEANEPILYVGVEALEHERSNDIVISLIQNVLDKHIRPAAQEDGGDILLDSYENGVLKLAMHGACHFCPYSKDTVLKGVEPLMRSLVPEVHTVMATEWEKLRKK